MTTVNPMNSTVYLPLVVNSPYHAKVTDDQFWGAVGEALQRRRLRLGLKSTNAIQTAGGPTYKTAAAIENGRVGEIESLRLYAQAVNVSIVDLFRSVLARDEQAMSPELLEIIRKFEITTADGRAAIHATARAVPARAQVEETHDDLRDQREDKTHGPNAVQRRRVKK
jgi:hypothetical protein